MGREEWIAEMVASVLNQLPGGLGVTAHLHMKRAENACFQVGKGEQEGQPRKKVDATSILVNAMHMFESLRCRIMIVAPSKWNMACSELPLCCESRSSTSYERTTRKAKMCEFSSRITRTSVASTKAFDRE
jgi:hypothetical protein